MVVWLSGYVVMWFDFIDVDHQTTIKPINQ